MRAALLEESGQPLRIVDDVEIMEPRVGEVRVRVKYCGLCHSDLSIADGTLPLVDMPIILGHEAAGIVDSIGPGVTLLQPGDHVILTPTPPCGHCYYCQRGNHSICEEAQGIMTNTLADGATGLSRGGHKVMRGLGVGALAEYVTTPVSGAIKIDSELPLDTVCVIGCALQTGVGAVLNTARVETGATVLVLGAGGVAIAAVQGARLAGASTILVSEPLAARRQAALDFGATHVIDPSVEDVTARCLELTDGIGMDYAFEAVGSGALADTGLESIRRGGTLVCVGVAPLEEAIHIPCAAMFTVMEKTLCGCLLGSSNSRYEVPRLLRLWQAGKLDLEHMISSRRPLAEVNQGLDDLARGQGIRTVVEI